MGKGSSKIGTTNKKIHADINEEIQPEIEDLRYYSRSTMIMPTHPLVLEQQGPPSNPEADSSIRPYLPKNKLPPPDILHATR